MRGRVDFDSNEFHVRKTSGIYNRRLTGLPITFYGQLIKKESGTIIEGEFRVPASSKIPIGIWFGWGTFMWLFCAVNIFLGKFKDAFSAVLGVIGIPIFFGIVGLIMSSGDTEPEKIYILDFIKTTLDAKKIEG
ncbi:hypothetical protein [Clostridium sp.]|uniref:hypothetical protein n=1 Tax=Clostridium sp. TaxID=1506 RepID=UPI002620ACFE|nr:hypothetical protein [Clostridium sp.]